MKLAKILLLAAAVSALGTSICAADDGATLAKEASDFYGVYATFHPSDGIPDAKGRAKYAPFLSLALEKLLAQGDEAETRFAKANKDSPPLIEGDLFTSNFEGATTYQLGACTGDAKKGQCAVHLTYDDAKDNPKDKPITWNDRVYLVATPSGWRVDDIAYGASWAFGNKGKLTDTLRGAIANALN